MDLRKLKTLIDLVAESDIAELEVTEGESKVRIVKSSANPQGQMMMVPCCCWSLHRLLQPKLLTFDDNDEGCAFS